MILTMILACTGTPEIEDKDSGATDVGAGDTGDDTAETEDTDETTDSGDTSTTLPPSGTELTFLADGDTDGLTIALYPISDFETFIVYDPLFAEDFVSPFTIEPTAPPAEATSAADGYPGTVVGFAMVAVWEDDGDHVQEPGEDHVSASRLGLWVDGALPAEFDAIGVTLGWNILLVKDLFVSGTPEAVDITAIDLPLLQWRMSGTFGGTFEGDPDGVSVAAVPATIADGVLPATLLHDAPLASPAWSATLDGPPPADHYADIDDDGTTEGVELFLAYEDTMAPEGLNLGDLTGNPACASGRPVLIYWLERWDVLSNAVVWEASDLSPGWNVIDADGAAVAESDWGNLDFTPACTF